MRGATEDAQPDQIPRLWSTVPLKRLCDPAPVALGVPSRGRSAPYIGHSR